jgi:hypothetical protein
LGWWSVGTRCNESDWLAYKLAQMQTKKRFLGVVGLFNY